jgi:hypothetical protein
VALARGAPVGLKRHLGIAVCLHDDRLPADHDESECGTSPARSVTTVAPTPDTTITTWRHVISALKGCVAKDRCSRRRVDEFQLDVGRYPCAALVGGVPQAAGNRQDKPNEQDEHASTHQKRFYRVPPPSQRGLRHHLRRTA